MAKVHKDKAELDRMKREVAKSTVEKGVNECTRLTKIYEKKKMDLEKQYDDVRLKLEEEKTRVSDYYTYKFFAHEYITLILSDCLYNFIVQF